MYKCFKCGSNDIEQKYWINPNTGELKGKSNDDDIYWCCVCEEPCDIIEEDDKLNNKLNERNCD